MASAGVMAPPGPPYAPQVALLGGVPTVALDVPICAVLTFIYVCCAATHMTIFQINNRRGHKFILSGLTFGFCMARTITNIMRIVWATRQTNVSVAIAAQVLVAAGVVLLFVINTIFTQRILRAAHPNSGWHPFFKWFFRGIYALIIVSLVPLITVTVISFYTLDPNIRRIARDIQLYGQSAFTTIAFAPIPLVLGALVFPRQTRVEKFGTGRHRTKIALLLSSAALLTLGAAFRLGTSAKSPRPINDPAWYQSKACFYLFNFTIEIIVVITYAVMRVDKRFHIPNGAKGPGDYNGTSHPAKQRSLRILSEEEVFDEAPTPPEEVQDRRARSMVV